MGLRDGKAALVTGSGRGIGRGIALALAKAGAKVVVNDLGATLDGEGEEKTPADQVVDEILTNGGMAVTNYGSVSDWDQAHQMVDQVVEAFGRIDILVNVAGILRDRMIFNMTEAAWDAADNVNGQVFHPYGYGYTLLEQPHAVRSIRSDARWDPEELVKIFPQTLGENLKPPPAGGFGTKLDDRPAEEWTELAPGRRFWKSPWEEPG